MQKSFLYRSIEKVINQQGKETHLRKWLSTRKGPNTNMFAIKFFF